MANERVFNNLRSYLQIYFHDFTENTAQDVVNSLEEVQLAVLLCNPQLQCFYMCFFMVRLLSATTKTHVMHRLLGLIKIYVTILNITGKLQFIKQRLTLLSH